MIDKNYIELMNKEIDGLISADEKIKLDKFLLENSKAKNYYDEIILTNDYLSLIPDQEPSENLKKNIVNSIDYSRYSPTVKNKNSWNFLIGFNFKLAYTFAAGLIAGIIVFTVFSNNSVNLKDVSGTVGIPVSHVKTIDEIPLAFSGISGTIELKKLQNNFWFDVNYNSSQNFDIIITYPASIKFENIKPGSSTNNINFSKGTNFVKTVNSGNQQYNLLFLDNSSTPSDIQMQIINSGETVYNHKFSLR